MSFIPSLARLACIAACCAVVAGCGGSEFETSPGAGGAASSSSEQNAAQTRLQDCLREQGLDLPEPGEGGGGPGQFSDQEEFQEALDGPCAEYQDDAFGEFDPDDPEVQDAQAKFLQCMQDQGIDLPDMGAGGAPPAAGGIDQDDPDVQAAFEECQGELGDLPGPGGPGGGS